MSDDKFRLVTRSDFDGLVCAVLLKELDMIDDIKFVHPKDMQDGTILISGTDITTNLPYVEGVHLAFDHHSSEVSRVGGDPDNHIIDPKAPSAARVVYDHYGGKDKFPNVSVEMMEAVDKGDSAQYSEDEILNTTVTRSYAERKLDACTNEPLDVLLPLLTQSDRRRLGDAGFKSGLMFGRFEPGGNDKIRLEPSHFFVRAKKTTLTK